MASAREWTSLWLHFTEKVKKLCWQFLFSYFKWDLGPSSLLLAKSTNYRHKSFVTLASAREWTSLWFHFTEKVKKLSRQFSFSYFKWDLDPSSLLLAKSTNHRHKSFVTMASAREWTSLSLHFTEKVKKLSRHFLFSYFYWDIIKLLWGIFILDFL